MNSINLRNEFVFTLTTVCVNCAKRHERRAVLHYSQPGCCDGGPWPKQTEWQPPSTPGENDYRVQPHSLHGWPVGAVQTEAATPQEEAMPGLSVSLRLLMDVSSAGFDTR